MQIKMEIFENNFNLFPFYELISKYVPYPLEFVFSPTNCQPNDHETKAAIRYKAAGVHGKRGRAKRGEMI